MERECLRVTRGNECRIMQQCSREMLCFRPTTSNSKMGMKLHTDLTRKEVQRARVDLALQIVRMKGIIIIQLSGRLTKTVNNRTKRANLSRTTSQVRRLRSLIKSKATKSPRSTEKKRLKILTAQIRNTLKVKIKRLKEIHSL
jgi:hypothetical protein